MLQLFFICGENYKNIFTGPVAESMCLDTKKRQAYFNSASFVQQPPPPLHGLAAPELKSDRRQGCLSPPRGDFCGGGDDST
jgi:hypothetical protein